MCTEKKMDREREIGREWGRENKWKIWEGSRREKDRNNDKHVISPKNDVKKWLENINF